MQIELLIKSINLINFKCYVRKTIVFDDIETIFKMINGKGKTSIFDAISWILFGKDSYNRKVFDIKNKNTKEDTVVEAVFSLNNNELVLKKIFKDKYLNKYGREIPEYSGSTTEYFINNEQKKESEYQEYINSILDIKIFKILINPLYFNNLKYHERRDFITSLFKISNKEIIEKFDKLKPISDILETSENFQSLKDGLKENKKSTKQNIEKVKIKLEEIASMTAKIPYDINFDEIKSERDILILDNAKMEQEKNALKKVYEDNLDKKLNNLNLIKKDLINLNHKRMQLCNEIKTDQIIMDNLLAKDSLNNDLLKSHEKNIEYHKNKIDDMESDQAFLRDEWHRINNKEFTGFDCFMCGQKLPAKKLEEAKKEFEENKRNRLFEISDEGIKKSDLKRVSLDFITKSQYKIEEISKSLTDIKKEIYKIKSKGLNTGEIDKEINIVKQKIEDGENEIKKFLEPVVIRNNEMKIRANNERLDALNRLLNRNNDFTLAQERIIELRKEESEYIYNLNQTEQKLFLLDTFEAKKTELLEEKINSTFKCIYFKLTKNNSEDSDTFITQIDTSNGLIDYNFASTGEKITAGLNIINTVMEIHGIKVPVFVDNAESISRIDKLNTQVIKFYVELEK